MGAGEVVRRRPVQALREVLRPYAGFASPDRGTSGSHGLPSTDILVVIALGEHHLQFEGVGVAPSAHRAVAGGLMTMPFRVRQHNGFHGIQLRVSPLAARSLLGVPAGAIAGVVAELTDLVDLDPEHLVIAGWPQRFALLEASLLRMAASRTPAVRAELVHAWRLINGSDGRMQVAACADVVGWSRRRLTDRFTAEFGVSPKQLARLARWRASHRLVASGVGLADAAARSGYADQAHMTREWSSLTGWSPGMWVRCEGSDAIAQAG